MSDALTLAVKEDFDVFNALNILDNFDTFEVNKMNFKNKKSNKNIGIEIQSRRWKITLLFL